MGLLKRYALASLLALSLAAWSGDPANVAATATAPAPTFTATARALSDPVELAVADLAELAISLYLPAETAPATMHMGRSAYVSAAGDFTQAPSLDGA